MYRSFLLTFVLVVVMFSSYAQPSRWQQRVKYVMDINMDVSTNRYSGKQKLEYTNNSPDTLDKLFYHLYWNAFQPNSMMDVRSRELGKKSIGNKPDWDGRVRDRIYNLNENETVLLPVGERIAQIVFHETGEVEGNYGAGRDGGFSGKYQSGTDIDTIIKTWAPSMMLPQAWRDTRQMPSKIEGLSYD